VVSTKQDGQYGLGILTAFPVAERSRHGQKGDEPEAEKKQAAHQADTDQSTGRDSCYRGGQTTGA
jgi:hypothetical protein